MAKSRKRQQWVPPTAKEEAMQSPTFGPSDLIGLLTGTALINRAISGTKSVAKSVLKTSAIRLKQLPRQDTVKSWYRYYDITHKGKPATQSGGGYLPATKSLGVSKQDYSKFTGWKRAGQKDHDKKSGGEAVTFSKSFKDLLTPGQRALASKAQQERKKLDSNRAIWHEIGERIRRGDKTPDAVTRSLRKRLYTDTTKTQKEMLKKGYEEHLGGRTLQPKLPKLPSARDTTIVPKKAAEKAKREHEINERRGYGGGLWQRYADEPRSPKDIIDTDWWKDF